MAPPALLFPLVRLLSCLVLISLPAIALGAAYPFAVRWFVGGSARPGRGAGELYAVNTVGAAIGVLVSGFVIVTATRHFWNHARRRPGEQCLDWRRTLGGARRPRRGRRVWHYYRRQYRTPAAGAGNEPPRVEKERARHQAVATGSCPSDRQTVACRRGARSDRLFRRSCIRSSGPVCSRSSGVRRLTRLRRRWRRSLAASPSAPPARRRLLRRSGSLALWLSCALTRVRDRDTLDLFSRWKSMCRAPSSTT